MHSTITTFSGRTFDYENPKPDQISVIDIAHHLGNVCRFAGATKLHYSVAQHSIMVAGFCRDEIQLMELHPHYIMHGLLHDASEAYLGDVPTPWKQSVGFDMYREIEARVQKVIGEALDFDLTNPPEEVHKADKKAFYLEQAFLMNPPHSPENPYIEQAVEWQVLSPRNASQMWYALYEDTKGKLKPRIIVASS